MLRFLPKKNIKIILLIIVLTGFFFLIYEKKINKNYGYNKEGKKAANNIKKEYLNKDSDNDGLKDWEETLWKTDLNNSDTDNDGTSDGEEISLNRDPLIKGPDDFLKNYLEENATSTENLNLTQRIGRDFLFNYLSIKNMEDLSQEEKNNLVTEMLKKLNAGSPQVKYTIGDLKTTGDNSDENIKNYINNLGKVFKSFNALNKNDLGIFAEILSNEEENPDKLKELATNRLFYENAVYEMLKITIPSNYQNIHLSMMNNFYGAAQALSKMEGVYDDPAQAIIGFKEYMNESESSVKIFKSFKQKTGRDGIKINKNESGYIFWEKYFSEIP